MEIKVGDTLKWKDSAELHKVLDIQIPENGKGITWCGLERQNENILGLKEWSINYFYLKTLLDEGTISVNGIERKLNKHNL